MEVEHKDHEYLTSDTPLATYLIEQGFELLIIHYEDMPNSKQRATFAFQDSPKLRELANLYNRGEATINIAVYEHIKSKLITRIMRGLP